MRTRHLAGQCVKARLMSTLHTLSYTNLHPSYKYFTTVANDLSNTPIVHVITQRHTCMHMVMPKRYQCSSGTIATSSHMNLKLNNAKSVQELFSFFKRHSDDFDLLHMTQLLQRIAKFSLRQGNRSGWTGFRTPQVIPRSTIKKNIL